MPSTTFHCAMVTAVKPRVQCAAQCQHCELIESGKCWTCKGEGAVGTGISNSFVDISDAMICPTCGGSGKK